MGIYSKIFIEQQAILEANNFGSAESFLTLIYQHMIKYQFNPTKQSGSWINTITTSRIDLEAICKNKTILNKLRESQGKCYKKGLSKAFEEDAKSYGYLKSVKNNIPDNVNDAGYYYNLDNLLSEAIMNQFLNEYVYHDYAKKHLEGGK